MLRHGKAKTPTTPDESEDLRGHIQAMLTSVRDDIRHDVQELTTRLYDDVATLVKHMNESGSLSPKVVPRNHRRSEDLAFPVPTSTDSVVLGPSGIPKLERRSGILGSESEPGTPKLKHQRKFLRTTLHHAVRSKTNTKKKAARGLIQGRAFSNSVILEQIGESMGTQSFVDSDREFTLDVLPDIIDGYTRLSVPLGSRETTEETLFGVEPVVDHHNATKEPSLLKWFVESSELETVTCCLIIFNAILIGIETEVQLKGGHYQFFSIADTVLGAMFACELGLRLYVFKSGFFFTKDWTWNLFDCIVVGQQVVETCLRFLELSGSKHVSMSYLRILRLARILRITRILRLVRIVRFIGELRTIANSVMASMKSLIWTLLLMFMVIYIVAVFVCGTVLEHRSENISDVEGIQQLMATYGSLPLAIFTLYESITGGLNWQHAVQPLVVHISPLLAGLFGFYIAFCIFCVMNVVTGVFCDKAAETAQQEKDEEILNLLSKMFEHISKDPHGKISFDDFKKQCGTEEMQHYFDALHIDIVEPEFVFELIDVKGTGLIDPVDFCSVCLRLRGPAQAIELRMLMHETASLVEAVAGIESTLALVSHQLNGMPSMLFTQTESEGRNNKISQYTAGAFDS